MATVLRILVVLALALVFLQLLYYGFRIKGHALGEFPIAWPALVLSKLSMIVSLSLLLWEAIRGRGELSPVLAIVCACLLTGGTVIFALGFPKLGTSLRIGLPREETALVTSGIYGLSRNPIYLAIFCLLGASLLYAFSWVNLAAVLISVALHHRIVLAEETYLVNRFVEYSSYKRRVRRYL